MDQFLQVVTPILEDIGAFFLNVYAYIEDIWASIFKAINGGEPPFEAWYVLAGLGAFILILILIGIFTPKKVKIEFYETKNVRRVIYCRYKKNIKYPKIKAPKGKVLKGWYLDKAFTKPYESLVLDTKKTLKLYAKFEDKVSLTAVNEAVIEPTVAIEEPTVAPIVEPTVAINEPTVAPIVEPIVEPIVNDTVAPIPTISEAPTQVVAPIPTVAEPVIVAPISAVEDLAYEPSVPSVKTLGEIYDEVRANILGYVRANAYAKVGVFAKQFIAQMFERDNKIYLYLAIDPELMISKGYNVEKYAEREFAVVPCKKVLTTEADLVEAFKLIEETMNFNNFVKNKAVFARKVVSDEQARRSGFAFSYKNEIVATTADEYYKILRAISNSYVATSESYKKVEFKNKHILKIFKKDDSVYLYLALNPEKVGLENVSYDVNYVETPAKFVVKTADDFKTAMALIEKLMVSFSMVKHPEKAELAFSEELPAVCGFGYRLRF